MANNPLTTAEQERVQRKDLNDPLRPEVSPGASGVNVYDRPATTRAATNNTFSIILAILALLILAYFIFQWLF
jgi:hypothetical protein